MGRVPKSIGVELDSLDSGTTLGVAPVLNPADRLGYALAAQPGRETCLDLLPSEDEPAGRQGDN